MARPPKWSQEILIEKIRKWTVKHGEPPKVNDWRGPQQSKWPSYITVIRYFGTWDEAIKRAGYKPRGRGRPKSDD